MIGEKNTEIAKSYQLTKNNLTASLGGAIMVAKGGDRVNFTQRTLESLADIYAGASGAGDSGEYACKVIQPNSFSDLGVLGSFEIQYHKEETVRKLSLRAGDILVKRLNPSYVFVASEDEAGAVVSQNLLVFRPRSEINPLYRVLLTRARQGMIIFISNGSDTDETRKRG